MMPGLISGNSAGAEGKGAYRPQYLASDVCQASSLPRLSAASQPDAALSPAAEAARSFEERLAERCTSAVFCSSPFLRLLRAEEEICSAPVLRLSLETLLLQAMKAVASAAGHAGTWCYRPMSPPDSRDWRNLQALVRRAIPALEHTLFAAAKPCWSIQDSWRAMTRCNCWKSCVMPAHSGRTLLVLCAHSVR